VTVRVRLFAILRERAGSDSLDVDLAEGATVADAVRALSELPALTGVLDRMSVAMAVNREYATTDTRLVEQDELALIPPISGGAPSSATSSLEESNLTAGACRDGTRFLSGNENSGVIVPRRVGAKG
jgi:molybdopterin synthase catalytic subunit